MVVYLHENAASQWLASEGGDEGDAMGGLVSRLKFAMLLERPKQKSTWEQHIT